MPRKREQPISQLDEEQRLETDDFPGMEAEDREAAAEEAFVAGMQNGNRSAFLIGLSEDDVAVMERYEAKNVPISTATEHLAMVLGQKTHIRNISKRLIPVTAAGIAAYIEYILSLDPSQETPRIREMLNRFHGRIVRLMEVTVEVSREQQQNAAQDLD